MNTTWMIDSCPDAEGNATIRLNDNTEHGNTAVDPVATVYDDNHARLIVLAPELHALVQAFYQDEMSLKPPFRNEALCEEAEDVLNLIGY